MKNSIELKQERKAKFDALSALLNTAKTEKREFSETEKTSFDSLDAEIRNLDTKITDAENREALELRMAQNQGVTKIENKVTKSDFSEFRFVEAINQAKSGQLTGIYKEINEAGQAEIRSFGGNVNGGFTIPSTLLRTLTAENGGESIVGTTKVGFIDVLREGSLLERVGATFMTDLVGNISYTRQNTKGTSSWLNENEKGAKSTVAMGNVDLSPKRLYTQRDVSNQLLIQTSNSVEEKLRNDIIASIRESLDQAFINGNGVKAPLGILTMSGTTIVSLGTNGAVITYDSVLELEQKLFEANVNKESIKFLISPKMQRVLKKTKMDDGSGLMVLDKDGLLGYKYEVSNYVPNNLTKGTGTNLTAILAGDFSSVMVGQWGGINIVVDNLTKAEDGETSLKINSYWDIDFERLTDFAIVKDAV